MDLSSGKRLIGDLKSKLGLGAKQPAQDYDAAYDDAYYEEGYADDFGDGYDDYGEFEAYGRDYVDDGYGYDEGYGYPDDDYRDQRRTNAGTRARNVGRNTGYVGSSYDAPRSARDRGASGLPRLLSIDEVRDRTRATRSARAEAPSGDFGAEPRSSRTATSAPLPRRSGNFDSLPFPMPEPASEQPVEAHSGRFLSLLDADPASPNGDVSRIRALTVLKPVRYGEAERITEVLKKDDVAVLDLRGAAKGLDKRILDFSFGAASVLDASVECVADKVFVVCPGGGLTPEERTQLQAQGVI